MDREQGNWLGAGLILDSFFTPVERSEAAPNSEYDIGILSFATAAGCVSVPGSLASLYALSAGSADSTAEMIFVGKLVA